MHVELIAVGDELLLGFTRDSNAEWLARELAAIGARVTRRSTVGDRADEIAQVVGDALQRTGAVITTGGLGPTADDLTKGAVAPLFGRRLLFEPAIWDGLQRLWRERGRKGALPEANRQQAMIPEGATILHNRYGTAPGLWLEDERQRWAALLPGVPREMRGMAQDELLPRLRALLGDAAHVVQSYTVRTTGVAESQLPALLGDAAESVDGIPVAYQPSAAGVDVRLTLSAPPAEAARRLTQAGALLAARIGSYVYASGDTDLAAVVLDACRERRWRLAVAESCTGGLLGARLTSIPGSSAVFLGGVIAYGNSIKQSLLHVPQDDLSAHGAVSEAVARAMASGARAATGAEIGVAITGIAGPDGGTPEKPVGLVCIAAETARAVDTYTGRLIGDREEIRFRATQVALDIVRRALAKS